MSRTRGPSYVVATIKPWNLAQYAARVQGWPGAWHLLSDAEELTHESLSAIAPRYVFFPHWSWKVPAEITRDFECVCFHMTDLPYGRGGSPLQNLIVRGHEETVISALRMTSELDAGPIYMKAPLSLDGSAQHVFERASAVVCGMIEKIATTSPQPQPQSGQPVHFKRRTPAESELPQDGSIKGIYDHIRMLDAETYPKAFLQHGAFRIEFSDGVLTADCVEAKVRITRGEPKK